MKLWKYLLYVFSGTITASKAYHVMMNSSGTGNQPSISLMWHHDVQKQRYLINTSY
jgi:hypothetical protein